MFVVSGVGLGSIRHAQNGGKKHRYGVGYWDTCMMDRDRRLTGYLRGQTDKVEAPKGFEVNNPWKVCTGFFVWCVCGNWTNVVGDVDWRRGRRMMDAG